MYAPVNGSNYTVGSDILRTHESRVVRSVDGWNVCPGGISYASFDLKGGYLDISYKKWKFTEMFQFFLEDKKADKSKVLDKRAKVSTDKWMFISRLIYTVGYDGKRYNEEYDEDGNKNRMLSNLLRRYSKEEFPTVIGHYYMC